MEDKNFGLLFKKFRERKGLKTFEVAEGIVSVQFLRRFEKGESDIKFSNFYQLLNRINVSFAEFMYEMKIDSLDYIIEELEKEFDIIITTNNTVGLAGLIKYFGEEYKKSNELRDLHFYIVSKIVYNQYFAGNYTIEKEYLFEYLSQCDTWCKYEYFIANYSVTVFDDEKLYKLAKLGFDMSMKNRNTRHYLIDFVLHSCMEFILRDSDEYAIKILDIYNNDSEIKPILQYLSFNITAIFLEEVISAKKNNKESIEKCKEIISFYYNTIGYTDYANKMQKFYNKVIIENII